jgi:hypothetical protein
VFNNRLAADHQELIARQERIADDYQQTADRIGAGVDQLSASTGSIAGAVIGVSENNRQAIELIQQYLAGACYLQAEGSQIKGTKPYIFDMGDYIDPGGGTAMGD